MKKTPKVKEMRDPTDPKRENQRQLLPGKFQFVWNNL